MKNFDENNIALMAALDEDMATTEPSVGEEILLEKPLPAQGDVQNVAELRTLAERLSKTIVRVRIICKWWRGVAKLKDAEVKGSGVHLEIGEDVSTPSLYVMPKAWRKRFERIENHIRGAATVGAFQLRAYELGDEFTEDMVSWTAVTALTDVVESMSCEKKALAQAEGEQKGIIVDDATLLTEEQAATNRKEVERLVAEEWTPAVREFLTTYPDVIEEFKKEKQPAVFSLVAPHLPQTPEELYYRFKVLWVPMPLGMSADSLTVQALQAEAGDYITMLRDSLVKQTVDKVRTAAGRLHDLVKNGSMLKSDTFESVSRAIDTFRLLSAQGIIGDQDTLAALTAAEGQLKTMTIQEINQSSRHGAGDAAKKLMAAMDQIVGSVSAATAPTLTPSGRPAGRRRSIQV